MGAVQLTVAVVLLAVTTPFTPVGVPGVVYGVKELLAVEKDPVPAAFIAATRNVYVAPVVNPEENEYVVDVLLLVCVMVVESLVLVALTE